MPSMQFEAAMKTGPAGLRRLPTPGIPIKEGA
jgi:hypothetical protein